MKRAPFASDGMAAFPSSQKGTGARRTRKVGNEYSHDTTCLKAGGTEAKGREGEERRRVQDLEGEGSVKRRRKNVYRGKGGVQ